PAHIAAGLQRGWSTGVGLSQSEQLLHAAAHLAQGRTGRRGPVRQSLLSGTRSERRRIVLAPRAPLGGVRARRRSDPGAARVGRLAAPAFREAAERSAVSGPALREGAATQPDRHAGGLSAPRGAAARRPARAGDRRLRGLAPGIGRASTL